MPKFSQRQAAYAKVFNLTSNYTPQLVVDGQSEFVGSKFTTALKEIEKVAMNDKGKVEISLKKELINLSLNIKVSGLNTKEDSDVWLAVSEDDLETDVKHGENRGRKLSHVSVVRTLEQIGYVATGEETFEIEKGMKLDSSWKEKNLNFIVFVQNKNSKSVVAIGKTKLN